MFLGDCSAPTWMCSWMGGTPDADSVNVSKIRMVDRVLEGNVLQVRLFLPLPVDQQLVGVGKDHAFGQRLTIIFLLF